MAAADTATTTDTTADAPAEAPAKPAIKAPSMVTDGEGRYGLMVGTDDDGNNLIAWLPAAAAYGLDVTKVG